MNAKQIELLRQIESDLLATAMKVEAGTLSDKEKLDIWEEVKSEIASELRYRARKIIAVIGDKSE